MTTDAPPPPDETSGGEGASEGGLAVVVQRHPGGRPSLLSEEVMAVIEEALFVGCSPELACERAGIHRATYYRWKKLGEEQPGGLHAEFCDRITRALANFAFEASKAVRFAGLMPVGASAWQATMRLLESRFPKDYGKTQTLEVTGKDGGPLRFDPAALTDEQLERIARADGTRTGGGGA